MALFIQLRQIEKSCIAKHAQILFRFFALRPDRHSNDGPSRCPLRWEPLSSRVSLVLTNCYDIKINMISMRNSKIINATEMKILPQQNNYEEISIKLIQLVAAAIAPWYCLSLPSCSRRFESQAHHLGFINLYYWNCNEKRTKINKKRPGSAHFLINSTYQALHKQGKLLNFNLMLRNASFSVLFKHNFLEMKL